ncbi:MAG: 50S ribosomal protein L11 methyltransferase [Sphingomonas sp.]
MAGWKITLPCTRAEAEAVEIDDPALLALDPLPVLMTSECAPDDAGSWQLDAYFESKPNSGMIDAVRALVPGAAGRRAKVERIRDMDWVTLSQAGIAPVHAGRFYVHTSTNKGAVPPGARAFRIEASLAFGTGQHETTTGCLLALEAMKARGAMVRNLLDLGTGTGLLAFAAMHLWPRAYATASDIDPMSVEITRANAGGKRRRAGRRAGRAGAGGGGGAQPRAAGRARAL